MVGVIVRTEVNRITRYTKIYRSQREFLLDDVISMTYSNQKGGGPSILVIY